jgi:hypothetical protein
VFYSGQLLIVFDAEAVDVAGPEPRPVARSSDPSTSWQAAEIAEINAGTNRALALEALRAAGAAGLTDFQLAEITGVQQTSIGKRRGELVRMGLVVGTGETRPSPSGSPALVWRAV